MAQSVTAYARPAVTADDQRRDDEAWNVPRRSSERAGQASVRAGLDWVEFVDAYFPGSRRHDLAAVAAYGAYKRRTEAPSDRKSGVQ